MQAPDPMAEERAPARRSWYRRTPVNLGELAVQTTAVVFGILLALGIDSWYDGRKDRALVDSAMQSVQAEIARNRDAVLEHQRHMQAMADVMAERNPADAAPRSCMAWDGWSGLSEPMLLDTAYEVAIVTQALAKMPFADASRIGEAYGSQRYIQDMYDKAGEMLISERPAPLAMCVGIAREIGHASGSLAERYGALLEQAPR